jgi:hypothetical protein
MRSDDPDDEMSTVDIESGPGNATAGRQRNDSHAAEPSTTFDTRVRDVFVVRRRKHPVIPALFWLIRGWKAPAGHCRGILHFSVNLDYMFRVST